MAVCLDFPHRAERLGDTGFCFHYPGEDQGPLHATAAECRVRDNLRIGPSGVGTVNSRGER